MRGIILAAGRGSRMGSMTDVLPKCLTRLMGRPLLDWQLWALREAGVDDVTVIRGYRRECLPGPGYATRDNEDWASTNMVATLACATDLLEAEPVIVSYGDIVYRPEHVRALQGAEDPIAITYDEQWRGLWDARFEHPEDDAESFVQRDGRLVEIGGRPRQLDEVRGQYMGLLRFTPEGWAEVRDCLAELDTQRRAKIDMTSLLRALLERDVRIGAVPVQGGWCEVDNAEDVALYERRADEAAWAHDWRR